MQYKNDPDPLTLIEIDKTLTFIRTYAHSLEEQPGNSKWTTGNRIFSYAEDKPGIYVYMIGALKNGKVTWHMMPMYGLEEMRDKWSKRLRPFVSGKSCIQFRKFDDLPIDATTDIVSNGTDLFKQVMVDYRAKRAKK